MEDSMMASNGSPSETCSKPSQLVWYITGTSSGFGRRLVPLLLECGEKVIATARTLSKIEDLPKTENLRLQQLDVTDGAEAIKRKVDEAVTWFGRVDVLVNNAGVSVHSIIEEGGSEQFRRQFDTNVFGQLDVTTAVLSHMRPRRSGTIVMMGSRLSWWPVNPTSGLYASSKAALRVLSETLSHELAPLSIRVLILEPAAFRTNIFAGPFFEGNPIADYAEVREASKDRLRRLEGRQPGDPVKAMRALVDVVRGEGFARGKEWPLYLPLGLEAEGAIRDKFRVLDGVIDGWGELIRDTRLSDP